ncbi:pleckstrin homology domain-containing family G member 1 isoform X2 [Arvicanthis niloticus]|uniref:pleckstrin homology domain-containing family G member 1 isoform X2 n=1 Tax=Arvicanthis niloticus TaxID=61156 RepID=UPI0014868CFC|nr:pleckstrin homology domain-containing family G member 1 [Arvicanthis niloticus]XP_034347937.1 pleckstrin homology domain-containing family G member 1 [Arvicanthis niloticus]
MELSDSDRPISFGSTSSSASSRDSHGSFGSRMTLVSNSHLGIFHQDKEAGAIKLELIPARPFSSSELQRDNPAGLPNMDEVSEKQPRTPWRVDTNGTSQTTADSASSPKLLYVDRVVQEILETERTYVQDLKSIVEDYLACIQEQTTLPLGTENRAALFGNIQDIYHFNSKLLQDLENCENDPVAIAECFVSKSEEFHIYTQYCTNYPRSVAVLAACMRNKVLAKFFRERQETLKHSLPLGSYLLKPVQRILKYHLLLHEIENHLDKNTEGYEVVLDAIDTMQRVAWHINDMKRKHEHAVRLQEIQSLLTNWKGPDLTSYGELVLEGTFRIQRAKNERTLFLLDKLLLITKKRDDTFTHKAHILCGNLMFVEVIPKDPLSFSVFDYKNPKLQHTVQAKSQQDKCLWILHLKRLILENHPAKIPAKAKQALLEMDAIHHPGFCYRPEGEMKTPCGSAPHRLRRKSEPSSRSHKVLKTSETAQDIQKVSREESSSPLTSVVPAQRNRQPSNAAVINMLRGGGGVRSLWTDHHIRQPLFPNRRSPQENEDDDDDYQMFVPSFSSSDLNSTRLCDENASSRPCSWHLGLIEPTEISSSGHRIVRRASSAGESNVCPPEVRIRDSVLSQYCPGRELQSSPQPGGEGGMTPFGSSVELTIDDIDHVYDNINLEDLKLMVAKRDETECSFSKSSRDSVRPKSTPELAFSKRQVSHSTSSLHSKKEAGPSGQEASNQSIHEFQEVKENIYDTIGLPDPPSMNFKCISLKQPKRSTFLGLEADFACCESLRPFVSQDSLQFSEDDVSYHQGPSDTSYLSLLYDSSRCNLPIADKALSDKLSEEVDEIWNDLENYIKKNEDKSRDRLLAAFPVSKDDAPERLHVERTQELSRDTGRATSMLALPQSQAFLTPEKNRIVRASRVNCSLDDDLISTEDSFLSLNQLSLASDAPPVDNPYDLVNCSLSQTDPETPDPGMEVTDKTKSRVFMMARQYSQKIKKVNQLLKVKNPELEQPPSNQHRPIHKDLVAILEEKRQGGPAIGARIAEYSQLYDQIVFRETPLKAQKDGWASTQEPTLHRPASPPQAQVAGEDWLWHSPYSNGELADFSSQTEQDSKSKYPIMLESITKITPRQLSAACSVPSLQVSDPLLGSVQQRCSVVVSQPHKEDSGQGHLYNSLGRKAISAKSQPYSRPQSSSSILINKSLDSINYPSETEKKQLLSSQKSPRGVSQQDLLSGLADSCQQDTGKRSNLTLQDSQKVLVVNRNLPLSAQIATQNYFSNFKETEGDEDDYVEIKSEEDEAGLDLSPRQGRKSDPEIPDPDCSDNMCSHGTLYSLKEPVSGRLGLSPYLTACKDSDKLNDYPWRGPSPNQQNIVQSLREKFQCLSSSSFA